MSSRMTRVSTVAVPAFLASCLCGAAPTSGAEGAAANPAPPSSLCGTPAPTVVVVVSQAAAPSGGRWVEAVYEERRAQVWVDAVYRTTSVPVWTPPVYRTRYERTWRPPVTRTVTERVWVPDVYEVREVVRCEGSATYTTRERVLVCPGHHETRATEVVESPGRFETVERQELVTPGCYRNEPRQELVSPGHFEYRTERVCVRPGYWASSEE